MQREISTCLNSFAIPTVENLAIKKRAKKQTNPQQSSHFQVVCMCLCFPGVSLYQQKTLSIHIGLCHLPVALNPGSINFWGHWVLGILRKCQGGQPQKVVWGTWHISNHQSLSLMWVKFSWFLPQNIFFCHGGCPLPIFQIQTLLSPEGFVAEWECWISKQLSTMVNAVGRGGVN